MHVTSLGVLKKKVKLNLSMEEAALAERRLQGIERKLT